jgi:hypothetical protein
MSTSSYPLTECTFVLGPPLHERARFAEFQTLALQGGAVAEHAWALREHAAVDALALRDGGVGTHTLLETMVGGVLQVGVIIADVERRWVRHADGQLYPALTFNTEDVRPRAAAVALQQPAAVNALNALGGSLSALDGREWLAWSSRHWFDHGGDEQLRRTTNLIAEIADAVLTTTPAAGRGDDEAPIELLGDLLHAIRLGVHHADRPQLPLSQELRTLRYLDPLRYEWNRLSMDAFILSAQPMERVRVQETVQEAAGLAYLYLGKERTDRLKADPYVTPRFRAEIAARTFMTAYALHRLAPMVSQQLLDTMNSG